MNYLVKTPLVLKYLFPRLIWDIPVEEKLIYLTFDDGPIPEITPWVLDQLDQYNAKASFFVVGHNVQKFPEIFNALIEAGHTIGNHTFNHFNGRKSSFEVYLDNVGKCAEVAPSNLFRPPYGQITNKQRKAILKQYQIIMWDVLSGDFDESMSPEKCAELSIKKIQPGSIVVFHDSEKAWERLRIALPRVLKHFTELGFRFEAIPEMTVGA